MSIFDATKCVAVAPVQVHLTNAQPVGILVRSSNAVDTNKNNADVPT